MKNKKQKNMNGKGIHKTTEIIVKKSNNELDSFMYRPTDRTKIIIKYNGDFIDTLNHNILVGDKVVIKNKNNHRKTKGVVIAICSYNWNYDKPSGINNRQSDLLATDNWNTACKKYRNQFMRMVKMKRKKYDIILEYINLCVKLGLDPMKDFKRIIKNIQTLKKGGVQEINDLIAENKILKAHNNITDNSGLSISPQERYSIISKQLSLPIDHIKQIIKSYSKIK